MKYIKFTIWLIPLIIVILWLTSQYSLEKYLDNNLDNIIKTHSTLVPKNGKWFINKITKKNEIVFVEFEDGHFLYDVKLECIRFPMVKCDIVEIYTK